MYSSLSWVPRGAPVTKLPENVNSDDEKLDADMLQSEMKPDATEDEVEQVMDDADEIGAESADENEVDIGDVLASELDSLAFHRRGEKDPYMASHRDATQLFDDEELDDMQIRATDAVVIASKSGEDASSLEMHVFDDDPDESDSDESSPYEPHIYVHHDIVLPALPLCTAVTRLPINGENLNLVAVGQFTPGIDIWDVDKVNHLEPVVSLGGFNSVQPVQQALSAARSARSKSKGKRKKKPKLRLRDDSHSDAVMSLSWNCVQREYLASGSADTTVKVWDIESSHCACTMPHHSGKVQAVAFHPSEAHLLASGSFDRSVAVVDLREQSTAASWSVSADVESCHWGTVDSNIVFVTAEDGSASAHDMRNSGTQSELVRWDMHKGPASACCLSTDVPGLLVSGGVDKMLKVWDIRKVKSGKAPELLYERRSRIGPLFAVSLCPLPEAASNASPFVVAYAGAKGVLKVADLGVESEAVRERFAGQCQKAALDAIKVRAARIAASSKARSAKQGGAANSQMEDEDEGEESSGEEEDDTDGESDA